MRFPAETADKKKSKKRKKVLRWRGDGEKSGSASARRGCKKPPVTVTREAEGRGRVFLPIGGETDAARQKRAAVRF